MHSHHPGHKISSRLIAKQLLLVAALLLSASFLLVAAHNLSPKTAFVSSEVKFTDASAHGMQIVPASCPSAPTSGDTPNGCDGIVPKCPDGSDAPGGNLANCSNTPSVPPIPLVCDGTPHALTTHIYTVPAGVTQVHVLVVGAGGGGGSGPDGTGIAAGGGGGGAGGFIENASYAVTSGANIPVLVGIGGVGGNSSANGENGQNSAFGTLTANGGGGGAVGGNFGRGSNGGSGGGNGGLATSNPGRGTAGQGNDGGVGGVLTGSGGGGGGGANGAGANAAASGSGGNGGSGKTSNVTGGQLHAVGGAGASARNGDVSGGTTGTTGAAGTGNGGGGSTAGAGASGGSGTVVVSCLPTIPPPTCTLSPASQSVVTGTSPTLNYTITGTATNATINGAVVPPNSSGSYNPSPSPTVDSNYTMTVSNSGGFSICGPVIATVTPNPNSCVVTPGGKPMTGYAWSDTVGWIDLNCSNSSVCSSNNFGMSVDSSGNISGCGWSDSTGWVSASAFDTSGCPSGSCQAHIPNNGLFTGWLKALGADNNGWDGWISLSGSNYGVANTNGTVSGFAWGSDVVGWVDWQYAQVPSASCSVTFDRNPYIKGGPPTTVTWTSANATSFTVNNIAPASLVQPNTAGSLTVAPAATTDYGGTAVGYLGNASCPATLTVQCSPSTTYSCVGAGNDTIRTKVIDATCNETTTDGPTCTSPQYCQAGVSTCQTSPPIVTTHLWADPSIVSVGTSTYLHWSVDPATVYSTNPCTVTGSNSPPDVWTAVSSGATGKKSSNLNKTTNFTLDCKGVTGTPHAVLETITVPILPVYQEK